MRFPVTFAQQRLWMIEQLEPGQPTWNMPYSFWLDGPLDAGALQRALNALAARQAALRTSIAALDGVPEQVIADTGTLPVEHIGLPADLGDAERTRQADAIMDDRARQPFDLAAGPLMRATLINAGPDRNLFGLVMHHIISDGLSLKIMIDELSALYRAEVTGVPAALPELWMEYGDYAVWQQDRMRGEELDRQLSYWRTQLRGAPQVITLPTDRPRPVRASVHGADAVVTVSAATTARLAEVAQDASATMFMVFFAGFVAVLSRFAGQTDIVTSTQLAGRSHADLDPIAGLFTNNLPVRVSLAGNPTFAGLLGQVRDATLDAMAHQQLPFEKLVDDLVPEPTLAYAPLAQVQFVHGSLTPPDLDLPGITARARALRTGTAKLDVSLYADLLDGEATTLRAEYSTDLFDQPWAERFVRCMATLLEHAAAAPGTAVADLPMLPAADFDALVTGRSDPAPGPHDVRPLIQASASQVIDGDGVTPVSQVCERAARIARVLAGHGVTTETPVGLCTGRGTGMLAALLGVWWAGGAYVPLDPDFPEARLAMMAQGAGLRFVVSDEAHRDLAKSVAEGATVVCLDDPAVAAAEPLEPVPLPARALAYIIFTSGSTGQPKGARNEHRGVANLLASFQHMLGLGPSDRFIAITTLSFDISLVELLLPLICGSDVVIMTADEARESDRLRSAVTRTGATVLQGTPQTWRLLAESSGGVPAGLRVRLSGGESLPADLAARLLTPGATLWNLYGPTEVSVWGSAGVVTSAETAPRIGPAIEHTRMYVLDERLMPVPVGVVGEICLAGHGVGRGYTGQPRLTARSFRPDPWSGEPGARMYRTGDLGRWREDGSLELIGRNDHQVKIRGYRIECGEIEAALRSHRDVRQAAVVAAPRGGEAALVAYIVPRRSSALAGPGTDLLAELRPHLRTLLPSYMVPALVVALPALPLTPSAKVDRAALPAPQWNTASPAAGATAPRNPVEETLARIWGDLLATDAGVGVHDSLFALGGHSLTATRFVARVADTYGVSLPVHHVFTSPTIAELAEVIAADPDFGAAARPSRFAELDSLSDEDLDELLRAALAQRNRRQADAGGPADHRGPELT